MTGNRMEMGEGSRDGRTGEGEKGKKKGLRCDMFMYQLPKMNVFIKHNKHINKKRR